MMRDKLAARVSSQARLLYLSKRPLASAINYIPLYRT